MVQQAQFGGANQNVGQIGDVGILPGGCVVQDPVELEVALVDSLVLLIDLLPEEFPPYLSEIPEPPKSLRLWGEPPNLDNKLLAVVGARKFSFYYFSSLFCINHWTNKGSVCHIT